MTEEDLKRWLSRANAIRMQREQYEAKAREVEAIALRTTRNYDINHVSVSSDPHRIMDSVVIKNDEFLDIIYDLICDEYAAKAEIFDLICKTLPDSRYRALMINRFLNGLTMKETAEAMEMGISRCNDYQKQALQMILNAISEGKYELFSALL